jgi:hypothetical protein
MLKLLLRLNPTDAQINNNTKGEVFYLGQKIGDLVYKTVNGEGEFFIVYFDGSSKYRCLHQ